MDTPVTPTTPADKLADAHVLFAQNMADMMANVNRAMGHSQLITDTVALLGDKATVYISTLSGNVHITLMVHRLSGFKDPTLLALLEPFADWRCSTNDYAYEGAAPNRDYSFTHPQHGWLQVYICAYVKSDSPTCRNVEVGSETVTHKRFAIVCD